MRRIRRRTQETRRQGIELYAAVGAHVVMKLCCTERALLNGNTSLTAMKELHDGQSARMPLSLPIILRKTARHIQQGKPIGQAEVLGKGINIIYRP